HRIVRDRALPARADGRARAPAGGLALALTSGRYTSALEVRSMKARLGARWVLAAAGIVLFAGPLPAQDWKGMGRFEGRVLDPDGKPVPDAVVKLELPSRGGGGTTLKTDKKGRWAVGGVASGRWNVDISAPGFADKKVSIDLPAESARLDPVEVK